MLKLASINNPAASEKKRGYTLIESLIALAVLMTVVLPLVGFLYKYNSGVQAQRSFAAMCLLEQEAALADVFPEDVVPAKRRVIDGREYIVTTAASGNGPLVYRMAATTDKREAAIVVFYGRKADASVR